MDFKKAADKIWMEDENGREIAVIDFPAEKENVVNITHTKVDDSLKGQGIAGKLTREAAEQLRAEGRKAVLTCSYAIKWFGSHPEYRDVLEDPEEEDRKAAELAGPACGIRRP